MKLKLLLMLMLLLPMLAILQSSCESKPKEAYAVLEDSTLTFYYDDKKPQGAYDVVNLIKNSYGFGCKKEWDSVRNHIKTIVFNQSFNNFRPKNCSHWFNDCKNLTSIIGLKENLNTSEVTDMSSMFSLCLRLENLDVSGFNTKNVTDMSHMFFGCQKVTSLDVSCFNINKVTNMEYMFYGCQKLTSLDVSGFYTGNVTDMCCMFSECYNLTSLDVSGFITDNVLRTAGMFKWCENLKTIYVGDGWNTNSVIWGKDMFNNCPNLIGGEGTKYDENHTDASYAHIDGGESNLGYFTKK